MTKCSVDECERAQEVALHRLCGAHYQQMRAGKPFTPVRPKRAAVDSPGVRDENGCKYCILCKSWQAEDQFCVSVRASDGLHTYCKMCMRNRKYLQRYGITYEQVQELRRAQNYRCLLCGTHEDDLDRPLCVDHDHEHCSKSQGCPECVRGLLCARCNGAIGLMDDSPERLEAAATYLRGCRAR